MILGVDIGGSHITVAIIQENHKDQIQQLFTMKIDHKDDQNLILESWISTMDLAIDHLDIKKLKGIGIAIPGPFDYKNGVFPDKGEHKFETLYNINLKNTIREQLKLDPSFPIRFYNDAACFGIGEAWTGELMTFKKSIAITLGTGFGATFIDKGIPVTSGEGVPLHGELYHLPFGDDIADTHFSTQWFQRRYNELTGDEIQGVKDLVKLKNIDQIKNQIFNEFAENLILFLAPWIVDFKAEAVVVGGNICNAWSFFETQLKKAKSTSNTRIPIIKSKLQENAALLGAARLIDNSFYSRL